MEAMAQDIQHKFAVVSGDQLLTNTLFVFIYLFTYL